MKSTAVQKAFHTTRMNSTTTREILRTTRWKEVIFSDLDSLLIDLEAIGLLVGFEWEHREMDLKTVPGPVRKNKVAAGWGVREYVRISGAGTVSDSREVQIRIVILRKAEMTVFKDTKADLPEQEKNIKCRVCIKFDSGDWEVHRFKFVGDVDPLSDNDWERMR